jgi:hypothetical protein
MPTIPRVPAPMIFDRTMNEPPSGGFSLVRTWLPAAQRLAAARLVRGAVSGHDLACNELVGFWWMRD